MERLEIMEWVLALLIHRDKMNAAIHMGNVHYSTVTKALAEEVREAREELGIPFVEGVWDKLEDLGFDPGGLENI